MEKTNRKSNHIKKISSLCPIKKVYYFCCCFEFFAPFIQIKWLYNICSTTCLAAPFKEALNQKGVFLTFYTMWCAGGWFPSFKCDEYFMTTGNCQAVWRLDGWGWRKKKVSYSRRTCCFYLLLNTWFVFCFPRVCILVYTYICMCYPKKGKFLRLGYGHIATITTSRESIYLVWLMFEESFDVCVMMSFWCRCFCFLIDVALWIIYSKTLWRIRHFYRKGPF